MEGKVILITGASGGMGTELANYFAGKGHSLALHANNNPVSIPESENIKHYKADLTEETECQTLISEVIEQFGRIDVLINNAGISKSSVLWKTSFEDWNDTLAVNLSAPFFLSKHIAPHLRDQESGRIINISSVVAQTGFVGTAAYAASKAGLIGLTKTAARELASKNVTVNALALGYFSVGMIEDVPEPIREDLIKNIPTGKLGDPETVCATIDYLISDSGGYITGQTINLNGGLYC